MSSYLNSLNNQQKLAVSNTEGPLQILAGAGSGKTKVLTSRIAYLIQQKKCLGQQILCVTFTNKAASEMRERVLKLVNSKSVAFPWLGTFHSICNKMLRKNAEAIGLKPNFTIIDTLDQIKLIKNILSAENIDIKKNPPKQIAFHIDQWKNKALLPEQVKLKNQEFNLVNALKVYKIYQKRLLVMNCVDFGDLILHVVTILKKFEDIKKIYQRNFKYILVDEFQDTNYVQNLWLQLLTSEKKNICVVGDDDQSIYSWRGAEVKNILEFKNNYQNTQTIKLEQNYRSTENILNSATSLISNNEDRLEKNIWSELGDGEKVKIKSYFDGISEATGISDIIEQNLSKKFKLNEISILVRAAFQTREFEERFIKIGLPYRIIGGLKFYERSEIKDALGYLRLINQSSDDISFERIVNNPKRSIGDSSIKKIHDFAREKDLSLFDASQEILKENILKPKTIQNLKSFLVNMISWKQKSKDIDHISLLEIVLDESGYSSMLKNERTPEADGRLENLKELKSSMKNYSSLNEFLENISLQTAIDEEWDGEKINIMTIHSAKGLEFDAVFLPGWEEGLFPHQKSIDEKGAEGIEEERRLAYVAITRAKKELFISFANQRKFYGRQNDNYDFYSSLQSRFIDEINDKYTEISIDDSAKDEFIFDQDFNIEGEKNSPGWNRLKSNFANKNQENIKTISYTENFTDFTVGETVKHEGFGLGKIIHIDGNKLLINFKEQGEKKVIDKFIQKASNE
ncbi:MAG: DNA helicase II [alpha proteobacterium HIMB114]|nr:MAG: DNA helicase II [alpha proteobacterium HIMB114]|tara:strand:+ start:19083 stop:21311 length:2229 start_codon:yes stop_codon:yes gene_type:complete